MTLVNYQMVDKNYRHITNLIPLHKKADITLNQLPIQLLVHLCADKSLTYNVVINYSNRTHILNQIL